MEQNIECKKYSFYLLCTRFIYTRTSSIYVMHELSRYEFDVQLIYDINVCHANDRLYPVVLLEFRQ